MQRFETKYDLLSAAYKDINLKKGTIALLQYLVHKSNKEQCFPAVETIAKALNVCKRTIQYNMRKLERAGYIIRKDRYYNHQQLTNQYVFNLGIHEDEEEPIKYNDAEWEKIQELLFTIPAEQGDMCQNQINKAIEILKIYNMSLSAREKLLLIYLFHRANKKGFVYDTITTFMSEIGVCNRTLVRLLNKLRRKNLIRVRCAVVSGRKVLLIKLTGRVWKKEEATAASTCEKIQDIQKQHIAQTVTSDQNQEMKNNVQNTQKENVKRKRKIRKEIFNICFFKNVGRKCKDIILSGIDKIREILRL